MTAPSFGAGQPGLRTSRSEATRAMRGAGSRELAYQSDRRSSYVYHTNKSFILAQGMNGPVRLLRQRS